MIVLDSDLLISLLQKDPAAIEAAKQIGESKERIATTVINAQEILIGAKPNEKQYAVTDQLLHSMEILDYDLVSVKYAVDIEHHLHRQGTPIGKFDTMIAAICVTANATIYTRNVDHFKKVPGLKVEKW